MNTEKIPAWREWMDRCAYRLVSPSRQAYLAAFLKARVGYHWRKLPHETSDWSQHFLGSPSSDSDGSLWTVFENATLHSGKTVKKLPPKKYLAQKMAESRHGHPEGLVSAIVRDFVGSVARREAREHPGKQGADSFDRVVDPISGATLMDVAGLAENFALGGIELQEFDEIAQHHAPACLTTLPQKYWPVLAALAYGWNLNDTRLQDLTGASSSTRYEWLDASRARIFRFCEDTFPKDPPEARAALAHFLALHVAILALGYLQKSGKFPESDEPGSFS